MKLHQILALLTVMAVGTYVFGLLGVASGLETPKWLLYTLPIIIRVLAASTCVIWAIGAAARKVL